MSYFKQVKKIKHTCTHTHIQSQRKLPSTSLPFFGFNNSCTSYSRYQKLSRLAIQDSVTLFFHCTALKTGQRPSFYSCAVWPNPVWLSVTVRFFVCFFHVVRTYQNVQFTCVHCLSPCQVCHIDHPRLIHLCHKHRTRSGSNDLYSSKFKMSKVWIFLSSEFSFKYVMKLISLVVIHIQGIRWFQFFRTL